MRKVVIFFLLALVAGCQDSNNPPSSKSKDISGDIIVFHAGSLSVPFQKIARAFEQENPGTSVLLEAAGSVECARKIADLQKPCDLMASSDYKVIQKFLIPEYTSWYMPFAGNEIVLAYTDKSKSGEIISEKNWPEILLNDEIHYGRSDPDADPCGYRTLMVMQLAVEYYGRQNLVEQLSSKDIKYIRPKEVDLLAMLELHETDYIFIYRSVAIQHKLRYLELPDEINLRKMELNEHYNQAVVSIKGNTPASMIEVQGEAITYAITMLDDAPNPEAAGAFLHFLLNEEKGIKILKEAGHNSLIPLARTQDMILPHYLKKYTVEKQ
jgi:molybdate/tungstate transport system substrate-binding protein